MSENIAIILSATITAFVTILGFVVSYFLNKRNFKEEVNKQKVNIYLDKIGDVPYKILELMDSIIIEKANQKTVLLKFQDLMITVFAYGSKDAITLIANMQELNYRVEHTPNEVDKNHVIAYYLLLLCQVKYDLTGIEINPEYWYRMKLKDYTKMKERLDKANNEIVQSLGLSPFLLIQ